MQPEASQPDHEAAASGVTRAHMVTILAGLLLFIAPLSHVQAQKPGGINPHAGVSVQPFPAGLRALQLGFRTGLDTGAAPYVHRDCAGGCRRAGRTVATPLRDAELTEFYAPIDRLDLGTGSSLSLGFAGSKLNMRVEF